MKFINKNDWLNPDKHRADRSKILMAKLEANIQQ